MDDFDTLAAAWGTAAADEWGYPRPSPKWLESLKGRLPAGLRSALAEAVDSGVVEVVDGHRFRLPQLPDNKGPYAFFSRSATEIPTANWEYFVQVAEYWRLTPIAERRELQVGFEDGLMDVTLRDDSELLWCIEVKEKSVGLGPLLAGIQAEGVHVDHDRPDRGDDALRKSKYLVAHRPPFLSLVAIGQRLDFAVEYADTGFRLGEDVVPYV